MAATYNPKDGEYYDVFTAEDAYYISLGRRDLVPGARIVPKPTLARPVTQKVRRGTLDPSTGEYYHANSAEDAYFISLGRRDLAPGCPRA
ncbi:MAG: hypothetical protein K8F91_26990 [Candidatus Obscuribacterales bacterium]|nr:hypothetical protein [Candidatus Obscuribacterales bacterium]